MEPTGSSEILEPAYQTTRYRIMHYHNIKGKGHFRSREITGENNLHIHSCDNVLFDKSFLKHLFSVLLSYPYLSLCLAVRVPGYRFRGPGFDSRRYQIYWEVVVLERGPLSLVKYN
jgi:hypothetical protein